MIGVDADAAAVNAMARGSQHLRRNELTATQSAEAADQAA
jgi:hypothetical protein